MTQWRRLYITVEGHTERKFADDLLRPHLAQYEIAVYTRVVVTNRKLGKRGGVLDFKTIHGDLRRLMLEHADPEVRFTTMLDLYALPSEFPGWHEAHKQATPDGRVKALESALSTVIDDTRFAQNVRTSARGSLDSKSWAGPPASSPCALCIYKRRSEHAGPVDPRRGVTGADQRRARGRGVHVTRAAIRPQRRRMLLSSAGAAAMAPAGRGRGCGDCCWSGAAAHMRH